MVQEKRSANSQLQEILLYLLSEGDINAFNPMVQLHFYKFNFLLEKLSQLPHKYATVYGDLSQNIVTAGVCFSAKIT